MSNFVILLIEIYCLKLQIDFHEVSSYLNLGKILIVGLGFVSHSNAPFIAFKMSKMLPLVALIPLEMESNVCIRIDNVSENY